MTADRLTEVTAAVAPPVLFSILVGLAWHGAVLLFDIQPYLLPGPLDVSTAVAANLPMLVNAASLTAQAALSGFLLSFVVGFLVAVLFSQSRIAERSLYPYAIFLQTVPIVAIAPLILLWIGHGLVGVIVVAFIISLFPIIANTTAGLTSVDAELLDLFALNEASRWQVLIKLQVPHAVPAMLTGARISCGLSVIGAIVGEIFAGYGTDFGLGYLILMTNAQSKTPYLFASVLFSTTLGLIFFGAVAGLSRTVLDRWGGRDNS
jgi:NitT/TauT family transport system permease protein